MVFTTGVLFFSCTWVVNLNQHLLSRFLPWRLLLDYSNPTRSLPILSVCRKDNSQSSTGSPWIKNIKGGPLKPENRPNKRPFCPPQKGHFRRKPAGLGMYFWNQWTAVFFSEKYLNAKNTQQISSVVGSCFIPFIDSLQNCINKYWF